MQLMQLTNATKRKYLTWALIGFSSLFVISLWLTQPNTAPASLDSRDDEWQQANYATPRTTPEHEQYLQKNPIWVSSAQAEKGQQAQSDSSAQNTQWKLRGVINQGNRLVAIIELNSDKSQLSQFERYSTGNTLANGEKILSISTNGITIETPDKTVAEIRLYQSDNQSK
jgi:hypothetical protein